MRYSFVFISICTSGSSLSATFSLKNYSDITAELNMMKEDYPSFVEVFNAQELYELDAPGLCGDDPCKQWIVHVTDLQTLPADPERPEVFLSGCLHGDEVVGPTAVMETVWLLLKAATCFSNRNATECSDPVFKGNSQYLSWLARLVFTRDLYVMPATNALGFYSSRREENGIDPNRDFPFHHSDQICMQTITARAVNEVWREHMFQLSLTFHGGTVAIGYEWGDMEHANKGEDISPDDKAQNQIGAALSLYGGDFTVDGVQFAHYPYQTMNSLVYPVTGGMEDWAYGGSWEGTQKSCTNTGHLYQHYPPDKTIYSSGTLRAFNMLIETSNKKRPLSNELGSNKDIFNPSSEYNGHIPRNIRLSLLMIDAVQPYIDWSESTLSALNSSSLLSFGSLTLSGSDPMSMNLNTTWQVGGCVSIDSTRLLFSSTNHRELSSSGSSSAIQRNWWFLLASSVRRHFGAFFKRFSTGRNLTEMQKNADMKQRSIEMDQTYKRRLFYPDALHWARQTKYGSDQMTGKCRWSKEFAGEKTSGPEFNVEVNMAELRSGNYFMIVEATVDQDWSTNESKTYPDVPPQSHVVNARTNEKWSYYSGNKTINGHLKWYSTPIFITIEQSSGLKEYPEGFSKVSEERIPVESAKRDTLLGLILIVAGSSLCACAVTAIFKRAAEKVSSLLRFPGSRSTRTTPEYAMVQLKNEDDLESQPGNALLLNQS